MAVKLADTTFGQTDRSDESAKLRTEELLRTEIDFIPHPDFADAFIPDSIVESVLRAPGVSAGPAGMPAHLQRMCETDLLTHEEESALFRAMNHLKFRANAIRSRLDPERLDTEAIDEIDELLRQARVIRDHIIRANTRLVMSIVKKFVTPQQSFDDMLSDGLFTLMHAVEKFDFDRGFRFSTYAYRSIARNAFRAVSAARKEESRLKRTTAEWALDYEDIRASSAMSERVWSNLRDLTSSMLQHLDRRERFIIRSRYALGSHRKVRTFQDLANRMGVSKERVRQLEQRAVGKLQRMAAKCELDEFCGFAKN